MMRPQPDCWFEGEVSTFVTQVSEARAGAPAGLGVVKRLAFLMKRRKTVSVTPAMGARTVAGAISTAPMAKRAGTRVCSGMACSRGASQRFCSSV